MKKFAGRTAASVEPSVDVVLMVLQAALAAQPTSTLLSSFLRQYHERGGLSKKQLEGLHSKAKKIEGISAAHLATLEAIILKKPTRYKTEVGASITQPPEDLDRPIIAKILTAYPEHKRVLFFKGKTDNREALSTPERDELKKFAKLLLLAES